MNKTVYVFEGYGQSLIVKFPNCGKGLGLSRFSLLPQLPLKMTLA